jgi:class 3 adenylate cyclase
LVEKNGKRHLAAIVFTDAVGFSALANRDEEKALALMAADMATIGQLATKHNGQILKSTGDGLMLRFDSAVQAVECAVEIQQGFARERDALTGGDFLQHRIGIHLGDVLVTGDDIMGDGVNIAARLQQSAQPGGICISQTIYDVVKSRIVPLNVVPRGAQQLKNIQEPVVLYDIGPPGTTLKALKGGGAFFKRALKVAGILMLVLLLLAIFSRTNQEMRGTASAPAPIAQKKPTDPTGPTESARAAEKKTTQAANSKNTDEVKAPRPAAAPKTEPFSAGQKATDPAPDMRGAYTRYMPAYQYEDFMAWIDSNQARLPDKASRQMARKLGELTLLKQWVVRSLLNRSKQNPVVIITANGKAKVWSDKAGVVTFFSGGVTGSKKLEELEPREVYGLCLFMIKDSGKGLEALSTLKRVDLFRGEYGLPRPRESLKQALPNRKER